MPYDPCLICLICLTCLTCLTCRHCRQYVTYLPPLLASLAVILHCKAWRDLRESCSSTCRTSSSGDSHGSGTHGVHFVTGWGGGELVTSKCGKVIRQEARHCPKVMHEVWLTLLQKRCRSLGGSFQLIIITHRGIGVAAFRDPGRSSPRRDIGG